MNSEKTNTPVKIFLTGATGYIGGAVLARLLEPSEAGKWEIAALVRSESAVPKLKELGVTPLLGSLDDSELITKAASEADVVLHLAHSDHLPAAKAIVKGCASGGKRRILIHTSGTGILVDDAKGNYTSDKIYNDLDIETIHALPMTQMHRDVDSYIFDNSEGFEAIIVCPPTIYGISKGPFKSNSFQIPFMIRSSIGYGSVTNIGKGINIWSHVHINDLAEFYFILLEKALEGKASTGRDGGWYFCESGEHYMKDLIAKIGEELYKAKAIKQAEPVEVEIEAAEQTFGRLVRTAIASNSRSRADRARALGWRPTTTESVYDSIEAEVKAILATLKN